MKGIVYWAPYICMHSTSVCEELGKRPHVIIAYKSLEYGTFGGLGTKDAEIVHAEGEDDVDILIQKTQKYVHTNQTLKTYPEIGIFGYVLRHLLTKGCFAMAVNMEQYQWWTLKGILRGLQWFYLFNIGQSRRIKAIGCTGWTGVLVFRKACISSKRLFDFIYSVPSPNSYLLEELRQVSYNHVNVQSGGIKFIYLGQIANRKCTLNLIQVFKKVEGNWSLDIIREGPQEKQLREVILGDSRFSYWGKLMPSEAHRLLSTIDVLLQVSKLEGWGCTVNETLMYGNRVIASDSVGSRALLRNRVDYEQIFESGNWDVLKNCIEYEIFRGSRTSEQREQISNDFRCIYPEAETRYFLQILDFYTGKNCVKVKAPWS